MSLPIAPRPIDGGNDPGHPPSPATLQKTRKISTACGACKMRKTRCTGGEPCDACTARNTVCNYDASSDQRRKIANQRNVQDLQEALHALERLQHFTGGLIALLRVGQPESVTEFHRLVRGGVDVSQLAAFVRNEVRADQHVEKALEEVNLHINGPLDLPSPTILLSSLGASQGNSESESGTSAYQTDPSLGR